MPLSEEQLAYARHRYAERIKNEEYREKVRQWGIEKYYRKKQRMLESGYVPKPVGRPRKNPENNVSVECGEDKK